MAFFPVWRAMSWLKPPSGPTSATFPLIFIMAPGSMNPVVVILSVATVDPSPGLSIWNSTSGS